MAPSSEKIGFWGKPTSTIDWCEDNYQVGRSFKVTRVELIFLDLVQCFVVNVVSKIINVVQL